MKIKLMIQSLSPLALLTIIKNFSLITVDNYGELLTKKEFIYTNIILLTVLSFCAIWVILSIVFYIEFIAFQYTDKKTGYDITINKEITEKSIDFLLTFIIPLLVDDIDTCQGAMVFFLLLFLICTLLCKTNLFYANPVLAILGYKIYEFSFVKNSEEKEKDLIGIYKGKFPKNVMYKKITDTVYILGK